MQEAFCVLEKEALWSDLKKNEETGGDALLRFLFSLTKTEYYMRIVPRTRLATF